jgi:hypothetical protein
MNIRNNNRRGMDRTEKQKKVIRCSFFKRVVWDNESSTNFNGKEDSLIQNSCKNCIHSF